MEYIKLQHIHKQFGDKKILNEIDLTFKKGQICAIIGDSGCGKSTLLNIIGLLEKPTRGTMDYEGYGEVHVNTSQSIKLLRYEITYLFQNYALIENESVQNNLYIALEYAPNRKDKTLIDKALQKANLPNPIKKKKVFTLSRGEQQRVAMVRVLLKPCSLVLADEPTGNLDEANKVEIFSLLEKMAEQDNIVIIVTHDKELASMCDQIISLNN